MSAVINEAQVFTLQSERIGKYWPEICKFLMMVERPDWTLDDVYESIINKEAQVWGMAENGEITGILLTQINFCAGEKYALVWIAAAKTGEGLTKGLPAFLEHCEPWFKELDCKYVKIVGRRGWKKTLPDYHEHTVELRKPL